MTLSAQTIVAVAIGGALGSVGRLVIGVQAATLFPALRYPLGTTVVNVVGCFLIGFLVEYGALRWADTPEWRAFLVVGFLGGFTTFSAFGLETVNLLRAGDLTLAAISVALQIIVGLLAVVSGTSAAKLFD